MSKITITKNCISKECPNKKLSNFEKRFELFIEKKVKKILDHPERYPEIQVIYGEDYEPGKF
ncbi:Uncharacterised protein [Streptococcus porcinus]|uniref:Uncharacterized protein n=1 Tax=Streptococcus porcinus TaxID=1340 RepID=A0A4U9ZP51_STRPO|nr:hypothetical protein [Streptococcus porcinus]MBA2796472.1 hypothetical protein [Streptococcus porcinus]VTS42773.1 Uncharacterised protein [Streptococcus porcinus]